MQKAARRDPVLEPGATFDAVVKLLGGRETVGIVYYERVLTRHRRVVVGCREEMLIGEHVDGHIVTEHFDLLSDVVEESVAGPPANHHDGVNCNMGKAHGHRGAGAD
eukprot:scaffold46041_cov57-Attheya_sp.AAC.3